MKAFLTGLALLLLSSCAPAKKASDEPDFDAALEAHLAAVSGRDMEGFLATITSGEDLQVIFPNGAVLADRSEVVSFHEEWFSDPNWVWEGEVIRVEEGMDQSVALVKYNYRDTPDGAPRQSWLVLVFRLENGSWRLFHDQNTRIE